MFGPGGRCIVVVGAQWGDEGKGKIVDIMSQHADLVVRYQGGANAGHTVVCGKEQFILHLVPSGILHQSALCLIANGVVVDPNTLIEEMEALEQRGTEVEGRLLVSDRAHLVLPYHVLLDRARERTGNIGTTGRGIGPAYEDKYGRRGIRVGDLRDGNRLRELVRINVERANRLCEMLDFSERADLADHLRLLERVGPRLLPLIADTGLLIHEAIKARRNVLLEGAQGTLLDVDHGTYPFVTSSSTTAGGAATGSGIGPTSIEAVLGVVKAYTTRAGTGPLPTEARDEVGERLRELGGEYGATTGRPRRCGWFDAVVASYAARVNGITQLAVTKLDVLDTVPSVPICVGYELDGERMDSFPADIGSLDRIEPVYEEMEGWATYTADARRPEDLPRQARAYLDRIAEMIEAPIAYVSVGSRRDQVIQFN
ncbi:MAG: adenylosuccinate synthetase [Gemmatimonas sp. SG8_17]|nr:MAG: adenylosuccinate synthetase [Gemmatimonas sp. SG8_17]